LSKTTEALTGLRERAQRSKDGDIKDQINALFDNVLQLKDVVSRLLDENKHLTRKLDEQQHPPEVPALKQVGEANYYYLKNDDGGFDGPYCQPCYDDKKKLVALTPQQQDDRGLFRRCLVCKQNFFEKSPKEHPSGGWFDGGSGGGPNSWMR
jgi:hypothetical protein